MYPCMPLWTGDLLRDTLHLNDREFGQYMFILLAMWNAGGSLPDDDKLLCRIGRCNTLATTVKDLFIFSNGLVTQKRLCEELFRVQKISYLNRLAGKASARARSLKRLKGHPTNVAKVLQQNGNNHTHTHIKEEVNNTPSSIPITKSNSDTDYSCFTGKIIKLNQRDYLLWERTFPYVHLDAYLLARDEFLADLDENDERRKKWMVSTSADLRNKNQKGKSERKQNGGLLPGGRLSFRPPIKDLSNEEWRRRRGEAKP